MIRDQDVIIVGAGLAGLACAVELARCGRRPLIVEKGSAVGGRIRTDRVDGFLLDRGFQVLLTAYPAARDLLDYNTLRLAPFDSGALIWRREGSRLKLVSDPLRHPSQTVRTLTSGIGTLADKVRLLAMRRAISRGTPRSVLEREEITTREALEQRFHFSTDMIEGFLKPFAAGFTLSPTLSASSRLFEYSMRMFSEGTAAVPAQGMQAIPEQLAARFTGMLSGQHLLLNTAVATLETGRVLLDDGQSLEASHVVVATDNPMAHLLLSNGIKKQKNVALADSRKVTTLYYAATQPPVGDRLLVLNGSGGHGLVNSVAVMSNVAPSYAPEGQSLVSVTVLGSPALDDNALDGAVRRELSTWFPESFEPALAETSAEKNWRHLRTYRIAHALPVQDPPVLSPPEREVHLGPGLWVCGDHRDQASIQGALASGRRTAEAIVRNG